MFPRKPLFHRQQFAQGPARAKSGFAPTQAGMQDGLIGSSDRLASAPHCYPFPIIWLSPAGVEPFFSAASASSAARQSLATCALKAVSSPADGAFTPLDDALHSGFITTSTRGKTSCGKSSLFSLSQPRLRAACKTPARALLRAPWSARLSRTPPTKTWSPVPHLAVLPGRPPARFRAQSAADTSGLTASAAKAGTKLATHGAFPVGGFSFPAPVAALT